MYSFVSSQNDRILSPYAPSQDLNAGGIAMMMVALFVSMIAGFFYNHYYYATVYKYTEGYADNLELDVSDLRKAGTKSLWKTFKVGVLMFLAYIALYIFIIVCSLINPYFGGFMVFILSFLALYLFVGSSMAHLSIVLEEAGARASLTRSFQLIKENWWSTFGLYVLVYLVLYGTMFIVFIPFYALMFGSMMLSGPSDGPPLMWMLLLYPVIFLILLVVGQILPVTISMNYFRIVEEKEHIGSKKDIENWDDLDEETPQIV
jgi:hypothetical protein